MANQYWTNPSVLALAGEHGDPVAVITRIARTVALDAMADGWKGPPFDPFELARRQGIEVVPREELRDARTVPVADERVRVEFNPNRPRGRLRFSIAHELAHAFFPDAAEAIRYRSGPSARADDWQMEMLCNIAAAELLMPVGTFIALGGAPLELPDLMRLRNQYDVSTEALLRRVVTLSDEPVTFFTASRPGDDRSDTPFRLDYVLRSRDGAPSPPPHLILPMQTLVRHCTAVGYADGGRETWDPGLGPLDIQAVGIPPFPGRVMPRVAGLLRTPDQSASERPRIRHVLGDASEPRTGGHWIIGHIVNDRTPNWGGAFARVLSGKHHALQDEFRHWAADPANLALGRVHFAKLEDGNIVASMVAQRDYGPRGRLKYGVLREALEQVANEARQAGASVHLPRIGAGMAGGQWDVIEEIIDLTLVRCGIEVTVYTLPGEHFEPSAQTALPIGG